MFAAAGCPDAIVVFVDAWTALGGSQFLNSASTGRYLDYLCDEVVPFVDGRYPVLPGRDHRGLSGHSSGGYGAMVVPIRIEGLEATLFSRLDRTQVRKRLFPKVKATVLPPTPAPTPPDRGVVSAI